MEDKWRKHKNWTLLGSDYQPSRHPADPTLPELPRVRVRALGRPDGSPCFCFAGRPVPVGTIVFVNADVLDMLIFTRRVELVQE